MSTDPFQSMRSLARVAILGFLAAAQGLAGMPAGRFNGGFRERPYGGFRYPYYHRTWWRGGWGPGFFLPALPFGCVAITWAGSPWYYGGDCWFRPFGAGFIVAAPPVGILVPSLPPDCTACVAGGVTYYWANGTYYTAATPGPGYVVAAPPPGLPPAGKPEDAVLDTLAILPRNGQNEEKMIADRREAQAYAMGRSGYDPARADPADPGTPRARQSYLRAMKSFLEARGYSVQ